MDELGLSLAGTPEALEGRLIAVEPADQRQGGGRALIDAMLVSPDRSVVGLALDYVLGIKHSR